ncbi:MULTISPECIES: N-acyl-D-amino-acid deacylase family protein [Pseudofrankia]|uniref:N-acyl-D-amino-acid deacylase family protein n=1 Tax=Pseudofrankia TaxID=2994363 RepID=UPI000234D8AA|nr:MULTISPECIES: amidohydrolase family protein [Pseudofrankia]OHV30909.1 amidohydrolase [Pseudofrankia sp. EUN1h]
MAAYDLVITGGTVVDGTGATPRVADVAVRDGILAAVTEPGVLDGAARERIDADGLLVTPGFVDIHTHYDGQATWDPLLTPSCWHGVTTVVAGNCGVGFAPAAPDRRDWLVSLMEGVEDIPGSALVEGMRWAWETFPEYLDALESTPRSLDIGVQIAHGPLRAYVMGERGARNEPATPADIERMATLVAEALRAGALGFSTSRTLTHRAIDGEPVPGTFAAEDELFGIGRALRDVGAGVFEVAPAGIVGADHADPYKEVAWMTRLAKEIDRPVTFGMNQTNDSPREYLDLLAAATAAAEAGDPLIPQVAGRASGLLFGLETTYHPFMHRPTWQRLVSLAPAQRLDRLREPAIRDAILSEPDPEGRPLILVLFADRTIPVTDELDYEPAVEASIGHLARTSGRTAFEVLYDLTVAGGPDQLFMMPIQNYADSSLDPVREMLLHPQAVIGLGDGGAHCGIICDASIPTTNLTLWTRDRTRGPRLPLQYIIRKQTRDTARLFGIRDRGVIAPGYKADLNLIDYERLRVRAPQIVHDLPGGAKRFIQRADGYAATLVSGQVVIRDGEPTDARPGRVIRGEQPSPR